MKIKTQQPKTYAATAAKSLQSCPTLCDPIDSSPPGSPIPGILHFFLFQLLQVQSQVIHFTFFLFLEVNLYCHEPSPQHCFYSVPQVLGCCVFIFIRFYAYFNFFFDFFCDLLVIQQRVVQPPYVGIFNSFSPVIDIYSYCIGIRKDAWNDFNFFLNLPRLDLWPRM